MVNKKVWRPFNKAREFVRSLNLRNRDGWYEYCKSGERPDDIPANPGIIYKNDGWNGWVDWLGDEWRPFEEAREFARSLNLKNEDEWEQYSKFGKDGIPKPNDIPSNPKSIYKNNGWKSYPDWLGNENITPYTVEWKPFEEGRDFARSLKLKSWVEWQQYLKSGKDGIPKPNDIPSSPDSNYKNDGWINWGDWLGTGSIAPKNREFLPFNKAREFVRSLNLRNRDGWYEYCKSGERPDDIPANPGIIYKNDGWKGMIDWLGNGIE